MADFAEKLGKLMGETSQAEWARRSGVKQTTISKYVLGKIRPSWDHVQALAIALNVSTELLRDDRPAVTPEPVALPKPRGRPKKA